LPNQIKPLHNVRGVDATLLIREIKEVTSYWEGNVIAIQEGGHILYGFGSRFIDKEMINNVGGPRFNTAKKRFQCQK
jgi:hypothetical protein